MSSEVSTEHYRGEPIGIAITQHPNGSFTAFGTLPNGDVLPVTGAHPTEGAAKSQALSDAVAALDRARSYVGKP